MKETIIVLGPEASGSRLVAKTIAVAKRVISSFDSWDGTLEVENNETIILHRSIPSGPEKYIVNIKELRNKYLVHKNLKIVFSTRDKNISQKSRNNPNKDHEKWIAANRKTILDAQKFNIPYIIFSYETFMLYRELYLKELLSFIDSDYFYMPKLTDGNKKYLK